jgi:DNA polymerase
MAPTPWGEDRPKLSFMGVNPFNHQWQRQTTYGGSLVENVVQAIARDLMAMAMYRCEQSGIYTPVLSVHDEMIAEADISAGTVREFEALMSELPSWAQGCPVAAEGWTGLRYRK